MNNRIINEFIEKLPQRKLALPIREIPFPNSYVMMCNPTYYALWRKLSTLNKAWDLISIFTDNFFTYLYMINTLGMMFSLEFHGVTAMRYQGFTEYKDTRLNSFDSQLKYVLNPNEYVFYGTPVYSMTDGEVVEVYNDIIDNVRINKVNTITRNMTIGYLYGNYICIKCNGLRYYYAGLQKNSMIKWKKGDKVNPGDILGKVGCCGRISRQPALHVECRSELNIELPSFFGELFIPIPLIKFEPFYEYQFLDSDRTNYETLVRTRVQDIKWQVNNIGSFMNSGSFVRKALNSNV